MTDPLESEKPNEATAPPNSEEPSLASETIDQIRETVRTNDTPIHEKTAAVLAGASLAIFGVTVLFPVVIGAIFGLKPGVADFVERLASIEIGPIGVIFGFYFSDKIRRGLS